MSQHTRTPVAPARPEKAATASAPRPSVWGGVGRGIVMVALTVLLALALAVAVVPRMMGGAALTVLSGSMSPAYSVGDIVVSVPQAHYSTGDIVTFQPESGDPTLVTHRIITIGSSAQGTTYVTRGDANTADDPPIVAEQIMGKVLYSIPQLGWVTNAAGNQRGPIVLVVGVILIGYGAWLVLSGLRDARRRAADAAAARRGSAP